MTTGSVSTKRGSDIHQKDSIGRTPLLLACLRGHLACVRLLGWSGFATADRLGQTPFHAACQSECPDLATYIYEQGVEIDSPAITNFMVQMQPSSKGTHLPMARVRLSPLWCAHNLYACACGSVVTALESKPKSDSPVFPVRWRSVLVWAGIHDGINAA